MYRALFSGHNASLRQLKKIRKVVSEHKDTFQPILTDYGYDKVADILRELLEGRVFESEIRAKVEFPEIFQTSPARSVQRAASENEAARSEAEAMEDLVAEDRIEERDEHEMQDCELQYFVILYFAT